MSDTKNKKKIRLTSLGKWLLFLALFLLFAGQNTGNNLFYLVSSSIITAFIFSFFDILIPLINFKAELNYPQIAIVGQMVDIICKIAKNKSLNRYFLRFEDSWLEKINKGDEGYLKKEIVLDKIGHFEIDGLSIIMPSMLDIFYFQYVFDKISINVIKDIDNGKNKIFVKKTEEDKIRSFGRDGEFYGMEPYHEGDDASHINWTVSSRSLEEWVVVREKIEEDNRKNINKEDELKANTNPLEYFSIKGLSYKELALLCLNKNIDKPVFRLMILLGLLVCFGLYYLGFLKNLTMVVACLFLLFGIKGEAINKRFHKIFYYISLLVGLYIFYKAFIISSSKIILLLEFSVLILVLQYLTMVTIRNLLAAITLVFMILLGIASMDVNAAFPAVFLPFMIFSSMILSFFRINLVSTGAVAKNSFSTNPKGIMGTALLIIFFILLWIPFFYLIPRTNSFGIASNLADEKNIKGFSSDTLSINSSGLLEDNQSVVLRIIPSDEQARNSEIINKMRGKLIRGSTFSVYENGEWKKNYNGKYYRNLEKSSGELLLDRNFRNSKKLYDFEIILEGVDNPIAFVPNQTKKIKFQNRGIGLGIDRSLYFTDRKSLANRKYVVSILMDEIIIQNSKIDELIRFTFDYRNLHYIVANGLSEKILELANSFAIKDDSIDGRVRLVMNYLKDNCSYSLEQPELAKGKDPLEDFLFGNKVGNCQHYATAMALLLRALAIPSRVVNGYIMGDWNEIGGFFTIRESNSHAWVEVFYPKSGWIPFDPTPPEESEESSAIEEFWDKLTDLYEGYWFNYIYSFDKLSQRKIIGNLITNILLVIDIVVGSPIFWLVIVFTSLFYFLFKKYIFGLYRYMKFYHWYPLSYSIWESGMIISRNNYETPSEYHNRLFSNNIIDNKNRKILKDIEELIDEYAFKKESNKSDLSKRINKLIHLLDIK